MGGIVLIFIIATVTISTAQDITTPTPPPELETDIEYINNLIVTNSCAIPCFWGVEIGVSDQQEAVDIFGQHFDLLSTETADGQMSIFYTDFVTDWSLGATENNTSGFGMYFREEDQLLVAFGLGFDTPEDSYVNWEPYLPQGIIKDYGVPDKILVRTPGDYDLWSPIIFIYQDLGLYINYEIDIIGRHDSNNTVFCNTITDMEAIYLWIEAPNLENVTELRPNKLQHLDSATKIEDVTPYHTAKFAELFSQEEMCITTHRGDDN